MKRIIVPGLLTLGFVIAIEQSQNFGVSIPFPFIILYLIVMGSAGLFGLGGGAISGAIAATFVHVPHSSSIGLEAVTSHGYFDVISTLLFLGSGIGVGFIRSVADRNQRRLQEMIAEQSNELQEFEERYALQLRAMNDGIWEWNIKTGECLLSRRHCEMLGYTQEELQPTLQTLLALIDEQDIDRISALAEMCATGERDKFETQMCLRHKSGTRVQVLVRGYLVRRDGEPSHVVGTSLDITERLRAMEMLERTEEMLYEGIQALPLGFAYFDSESKLVLFNDSYKRLLGSEDLRLRSSTTFAEVVRASAVTAAPDLGFDDTETYVRSRLEARRTKQPPWVFRCDEDTWVRMTEFATYSGGFVSLVEDVSEERRSQKRIQQKQRLEVIGQLTGGVAHDFNNVLAVIQGCTELMKLTPGSDVELIDQTLHAVDRGTSLTRRLLAYARQQPLLPSAIDCAGLVLDMEEVLRRTLGERIEVRVDLSSDLWAAHADASQVEDTLLNLALNARDAMPGGGTLRIACSNVTLDEDTAAQFTEASAGEYVRFAVSDTGTGMAPEVLDKAIEPFFTTKDIGKGSGLGLSMVYGFVRQSGGHLGIESVEGRGTTVSVFLPRDTNAQVADPPVTGASTAPRGNGQSLLVIEDDPLVRNLVVRSVADLGYMPTAVTDAAAAKALLDEGRRFELLLSDVVLPGGTSGPQFVRSLGALMPRNRVIFMSGYPEEEILSSDLDDGGHVLLQKPFRREDLAQALSNALRTPAHHLA